MVGGVSNKLREPGFGIFVKKILPRGRAAEDGKYYQCKILYLYVFKH